MLSFIRRGGILILSMDFQTVGQGLGLFFTLLFLQTTPKVASFLFLCLIL